VAPPPNWHVTLRFLGDVDRVGRDRLLMELADAGLGSGFELTLDRLGAFPKEKRASVLWAGIAGGEVRLDGLAGVVEEAVEAAGFNAEERPFHPHVTLSRIRPPQDLTRLIAGTGDLRVRTRVDALTLFRSHLGRGTAHYEILERFELS
jgi:2'-5' RNA ligase